MTVFVPQEPIRYRNGRPEPVFDLSPAAQFGELRVILENDQALFNTVPMVRRVRDALKDFNDDDFVLAVGDPSAIGVTTSIAAAMNRGRYKLLKWDRKAGCYIHLSIDISGRPYDG